LLAELGSIHEKENSKVKDHDDSVQRKFVSYLEGAGGGKRRAIVRFNASQQLVSSSSIHLIQYDRGI
jgi:hypothetical protein